MKKLFACLVLVVVSMSFKTVEPTVYHYPDFMMKMSNEFKGGVTVNPFPIMLTAEGFLNGVFVVDNSDYLQGVDSIATKHDVEIGTPKQKTVYDNFYARTGTQQWKKYGSDKKLIGVITELRSGSLTQGMKTDKWSVVYYAVK